MAKESSDRDYQETSRQLDADRSALVLHLYDLKLCEQKAGDGHDLKNLDATKAVPAMGRWIPYALVKTLGDQLEAICDLFCIVGLAIAEGEFSRSSASHLTDEGIAVSLRTG